MRSDLYILAPVVPPVTRSNIVKGLVIGLVEAVIIVAVCIHFV